MRPALRRLTIALGLAVVLYAAVCVLLFFTQDSLIYYPQPRSNRDGVSILTLRTDAGSVLVTTRPASGSGAVIYFGGNAEDVSLDLSDFSSAFPEDAIYLLHYRGYGGSAGKPSENGLYADALALFDQVHVQHPDIVVVGRSLGTAVALKVASSRAITRLVLITPFDRLGDVAAEQYSWLPVRMLLRDKFDSWRYAPQVTAPTRIIAAANDEIVPRSSTERLRTRFKPGITTYIVVPSAGHNTISDNPAYMGLVAKP